MEHNITRSGLRVGVFVVAMSAIGLIVLVLGMVRVVDGAVPAVRVLAPTSVVRGDDVPPPAVTTAPAPVAAPTPPPAPIAAPEAPNGSQSRSGASPAPPATAPTTTSPPVYLAEGPQPVGPSETYTVTLCQVTWTGYQQAPDLGGSPVPTSGRFGGDCATAQHISSLTGAPVTQSSYQETTVAGGMG